MSRGGEPLPLVYACSGCSNVGQLANEAALELDRLGLAEMSCTTGVGGGVPTLCQKARSGRHVIAIDGCHLHCAVACLARAEVRPDLHVTLAEQGLKKRRGSVDEGALPTLVSSLRAHLEGLASPRGA
jgi:uncharacterized metal-binding protein